MRKIKLLFTSLIISLSAVQAQVTVDGLKGTSETYTSLGMFTQPNTFFGSHGMLELNAATDINKKVYVFIKGEAEWNGNNFLLFLDVPSKNGIPKGSALPAGDDPQSPFNGVMTKMDMQCDYGFRMASSNYWNPVDGIIYPSVIDYEHPLAGPVYQDCYLDSVVSNGTTLNCHHVLKTGQTLFTKFNTMKMAYKHMQDIVNVTNQGWEIELDADSLGIMDGDSITLFAAYVSGDGKFFSGNCIPEIPNITNFLGSDGMGNFSASGATFDFAQLTDVQAVKYKVSFPTGVNTTSKNINYVNIQPNPASDKVLVNYNLNTASPVSIKVLNLLGAQMESYNTTGVVGGQSFTINTNNLNNGTYFVELNTNTGKEVKKLVVQH